MKDQNISPTSTSTSPNNEDSRCLFLAFELSNSRWNLSFSPGNLIKRNTSITAWDHEALLSEIRKAKDKFGLPHDAIIYSCYEAGRDGFALHRFLKNNNVTNVVVDSSSILVDRKAKHAKTDNLDVEALRMMLIRYHRGETKVWSTVQVPTVEQEDERNPSRELDGLKGERTRLTNRIGSLLILLGLRLKVGEKFLEELSKQVTAYGTPVPPNRKSELERAFLRWKVVCDQISILEEERERKHKEAASTAARVAALLQTLKGVGPVTAEKLTAELFWREFRNRKEIAAFAGLVPVPYCSGDSERCQGISKAGRSDIRKTMVELSWIWERYQPRSKISIWFQQCFGHGGKRFRKVGIVAVARKLLIALWRYAMDGVVPEGAIMKKAPC